MRKQRQSGRSHFTKLHENTTVTALKRFFSTLAVQVQRQRSAPISGRRKGAQNAQIRQAMQRNLYDHGYGDRTEGRKTGMPAGEMLNGTALLLYNNRNTTGPLLVM